MATNIRFQGLVKTTAEIEADKFAGRFGWNSTLARFVAYFTGTDYATMARKDVAETFPGLTVTNQAGTGSRLVSASSGGVQGATITEPTAFIQTLFNDSDAATAKTTLEVLQNIPLGVSAIGGSFRKIATITISSQAQQASFTAIVHPNALSTNSAAGVGSKLVTVAIGQIGAMSGPLDKIKVFVKNFGNPGTGKIYYRIDQDNVTAKIVSIYYDVVAGSDAYYTVLGAYGGVSFYNSPADYADPGGLVAGTSMAQYAKIYRTAAGVVQTIPTGTAWTKLTPFDTNDTDYAGSTPDQANDRIVIGRGGRYHVTFPRSISVGSANFNTYVAILKNGSAVPSSIRQKRITATSTAIDSELTDDITFAAGDVVTVGTYNDSASPVDLTYLNAVLSVHSID